MTKRAAVPAGTPIPRTRARGMRVLQGVKRWLRPGRSMAVGLALLALSCLTSLVLATVTASAAPTPSPTPSVGPTLPGPDNPLDPTPMVPDPGTSGRPDDSPLIRDGIKEAEEKEKAARAEFDELVAKYKKDRAAQGGVLSAFEVTDRDGNPVSSYRIYSDTGDWNDWDLSVEGFLVEMMFMGNKWIVSFACFLLTWSLAFSLAGLILKPALQVSTSLYGGVVVQMGLPALFLTFTMVVASWHLLFGNRVRGWGEMAAALVISALALGALASPPQLLLSTDTGVVGTVRALAVETAALVLDKEAIDTNRPTTDKEWEKKPSGSTVGAQVRSSPSALARPITDALVDAFVARPAMLLSYGRTFDGSCGKKFRDSRIQQAVFDQLVDSTMEKGKSFLKDLPFGIGLPDNVKNWMVDTAVDGTSSQMLEQVHAAGPIKAFEKACVPNAGTLKKASMDKVGGALFMLLAAFLTCAFVIVLDGAFLFAQLQIAIEAMIAKVALAAGILPGPGRAWLWDRAAAIARGLALMLASIAALSVFNVVVNAVLNTPESDLPGGVTVRFVLLDCVCVAAFIYRKKLARSTRGAVARARHRLGNSPLGGATSPAPASPPRRGGLGKGLLLGGLMLGAAVATGGTSAALGGAGRIGTTRLATRPARPQWRPRRGRTDTAHRPHHRSGRQRHREGRNVRPQGHRRTAGVRAARGPQGRRRRDRPARPGSQQSQQHRPEPSAGRPGPQSELRPARPAVRRGVPAQRALTRPDRPRPARPRPLHTAHRARCPPPTGTSHPARPRRIPGPCSACRTRRACGPAPPRASARRAAAHQRSPGQAPAATPPRPAATRHQRHSPGTPYNAPRHHTAAPCHTGRSATRYPRTRHETTPPHTSHAAARHRSQEAALRSAAGGLLSTPVAP
ncbi:hypothetical protein GCM10010207_83490 [Streptomyces atratus]|uniref:hypothetical protein n=1 Tax=Streptomyces atratus TaxID=1893 RepID=UPI001670B14F|nr:hypothetical protein [Streptomyces atratus]GGT72965.1 hypothetical protein GCM10010207_83490 [Streptomyces atratus]